MEAYAGSRSRMRTRRALTQPLGASSFISKTIVGDSCVRAFQSSRARPTDGSDVSHAGVCDVTLRLKRFARQCRKSSAHMVRTPRLPARRIHFSISSVRSDEILPLTEAKHDMARPRHRHHAKGHPTMLGSMQHTLDTKNG